MSTATRRRSSGVRYPARVMARAIEHREAGWTLREIQRMLADEFGCDPPSPATIATWTNPKLADRLRAAGRERQRRLRRDGMQYRMPTTRHADWRFGRMLALAEVEGLSCAAIARVMTFDFPDTPVTEHQVRYAIERGVVPRTLRGRPADG